MRLINGMLLTLESGVHWGYIGAETFAAVSPSSNQKLKRDIEKLRSRHESYKYAFFNAPEYCGTERHRRLEQGDVQVWSISLEY